METAPDFQALSRKEVKAFVNTRSHQIEEIRRRKAEMLEVSHNNTPKCYTTSIVVNWQKLGVVMGPDGRLSKSAVSEALFVQVDQNKDGVISRQEWDSATAEVESTAESMMSKFTEDVSQQLLSIPTLKLSCFPPRHRRNAGSRNPFSLTMVSARYPLPRDVVLRRSKLR